MEIHFIPDHRTMWGVLHFSLDWKELEIPLSHSNIIHFEKVAENIIPRVCEYYGKLNGSLLYNKIRQIIYSNNISLHKWQEEKKEEEERDEAFIIAEKALEYARDIKEKQDEIMEMRRAYYKKNNNNIITSIIWK